MGNYNDMTIFPRFDWKVQDVDPNVIKQDSSYKLLLQTWVPYSVDGDSYLVPVRLVWQVPETVEQCFDIIQLFLEKAQETIDEEVPMEEYKYNGKT